VDGAFVQDSTVTAIRVSSTEEVRRCFVICQQFRVVAKTSENALSSRSHACFSLAVTERGKARHTARKLTVIDLAGSEQVENVLDDKNLYQESRVINRSLLALSIFIGDLARAGKNQARVTSKRESLLTRLLYPMLSTAQGNASLILTCSNNPDYRHVKKNLRTFHFGNVAAKMQDHRSPQRKRKSQGIKNQRLTQARDHEMDTYGWNWFVDPVLVSNILRVLPPGSRKAILDGMQHTVQATASTKEVLQQQTIWT
jgi:hypothetical protein